MSNDQRSDALNTPMQHSDPRPAVSRRQTPWTDTDDARLVALLDAKACASQMTAALGRSVEAIDKRLARLGRKRTDRRRQPSDARAPM